MWGRILFVAVAFSTIGVFLWADARLVWPPPFKQVGLVFRLGNEACRIGGEAEQ